MEDYELIEIVAAVCEELTCDVIVPANVFFLHRLIGSNLPGAMPSLTSSVPCRVSKFVRTLRDRDPLD